MISTRQFNKLFKAFVFVVLSASVALNASGAAKMPNADAAKLQKREAKAYKAKKLTGVHIDILNRILVNFPTTALRMSMAAERGQIIVNVIEKLDILGVSPKGELVYFKTAEQEHEYVKNQLKFVLEPVEKFMEDIKEQREIVKKLLSDSLGADRADKSFISRALDEAKGSFLVYFNNTIKTVAELNTAATEFLMFFADVNESLSEKARAAMNKLIEELRAKSSKHNSNKK